MKRNIQIGLVVILAVLTVALVVYAVRSGGTDRSTSSGARITAPSPTPSATVAAPTPTLLVIGDSVAAGAGASNQGSSWVERVARRTGWQVQNRSVLGAGYLAHAAGDGSSCARPRCPSFATVLGRVGTGAAPDVVLVAGGRDDTGSTDSVQTPTRSFFAAARKRFPGATIVALDPAYDISTVLGSSVLTDGVRAAVRRAHGSYADVGQPLAGHVERLASDGSQPNDAGHRAIARAVLAKLRNLNLG